MRGFREASGVSGIFFVAPNPSGFAVEIKIYSEVDFLYEQRIKVRRADREDDA